MLNAGGGGAEAEVIASSFEAVEMEGRTVRRLAERFGSVG